MWILIASVPDLCILFTFCIQVYTTSVTEVEVARVKLV